MKSEISGVPVVHESGVPAHQPTMLEIISNMVNTPGKVDVEALHRLLDFQERIEKRDAEREFIHAFNRLQAELPVIAKNGKNEKTGKSYVLFEDAMKALQPLLTTHGFTVSFDEEEVTPAGIRFVLKLKHTGGHSEFTRRTFPTDAAAKNRDGISIRPAIQDAGSTSQYAKRYLLFQALNLVATDDPDTDGESIAKISKDEATVLRDLLVETNTSLETFFGKIVTAEGNSVDNILARDYGRAKNALETKKREMKKA